MIELERLPENLRLELEELLNSVSSNSNNPKPQNEPSPSFQNPAFPITDDVTVRRISTKRDVKTIGYLPRPITDGTEIKGIKEILEIDKKIPIDRNGSVFLSKAGIVVYDKNEIKKNMFYLDNLIMKQGSKKNIDFMDEKNTKKLSIYFHDSQSCKDFSKEYLGKFQEKSVKNTLARFFTKRPSRDDLLKQGIYKHEQVFGNYLSTVYANNDNRVPKLVTDIIQKLETEDNLNSLGLYRTSGNLAVIQKIRTEVDNGKFAILRDQDTDVDVLTGCLKLFFRELKEPLIPEMYSEQFYNALKDSKSNKNEIFSLIKKLPEGHADTMFVLFKHLLNVIRHQSQNKMDRYNLSVCWGPTLVEFKNNLKDLVANSAKAANCIDQLLRFYEIHKDELEREFHSRNKIRTEIRREKSFMGRSFKKEIDTSFVIVKKVIEFIEKCWVDPSLHNIIEGLYTKSGSSDKSDRIKKKIEQNKFKNLDKYKFDIHNVVAAFKRYVKDLKLISTENFRSCYDLPREQILEEIDKRDTLECLLNHINKVLQQKEQLKVDERKIISIWAQIFNSDITNDDNDKDKFTLFIKKLIVGNYNPRLPDVICETNMRHSYYENYPIPENTIQKTESTKL